MPLKQYLKQNKLTISSISKQSGVPFTTVSELVNGKTDIDKVQVGTCIKLSQTLGLSFDDFYALCKKALDIPVLSEGKIFVKNKAYYLSYSIDSTNQGIYLCKVNTVNTHFLKDLAEWTIMDIQKDMQEKQEAAEVESWTIDTFLCGKTK